MKESVAKHNYDGIDPVSTDLTLKLRILHMKKESLKSPMILEIGQLKAPEEYNMAW